MSQTLNLKKHPPCCWNQRRRGGECGLCFLSCFAWLVHSLALAAVALPTTDDNWRCFSVCLMVLPRRWSLFAGPARRAKLVLIWPGKNLAHPDSGLGRLCPTIGRVLNSLGSTARVAGPTGEPCSGLHRFTIQISHTWQASPILPGACRVGSR